MVVSLGFVLDISLHIMINHDISIASKLNCVYESHGLVGKRWIFSPQKNKRDEFEYVIGFTQKQKRIYGHHRLQAVSPLIQHPNQVPSDCSNRSLWKHHHLNRVNQQVVHGSFLMFISNCQRASPNMCLRLMWAK